MRLSHTSRRRFMAQFLTVAGTMVGPILGFSQTTGAKRRQDRRSDRTDRTQERDDKRQERRTDPIGVRAPQRREDRRDTRTDRKTDRRERIY